MKFLLYTVVLIPAFVACSRSVDRDPSALPAPVLRPMLEEFRAMAGADSISPLELDLHNSDATIRRDAALQLAEIGHPSAIPTLLLALKDERDTDVRLHFAEALARLGNLSALPDLIAGMRVDRFAQTAGVISMRILEAHFRSPGERPTYQFLRDELSTLHRLWLRYGRAPRSARVTLDKTTKARLAQHFANLEGFQLRQVDEARFVLSRVGIDDVPLLRAALRAKETYLRQHAMEILSRIGVPGRGAVPQVMVLLRAPMFRAQAARTLGELGDQKAVEPLLHLLHDPDLEVRCAAAGAFGLLRDQRATEPLRAILANSEQPMDLRVRAAFSLALLDPGGPGLRFLMERLDAGDYHRPTIEEFIARIARE